MQSKACDANLCRADDGIARAESPAMRLHGIVRNHVVQSPANHRCCDEISRERDRPPYGVLIDPVLFGSMKVLDGILGSSGL